MRDSGVYLDSFLWSPSGDAVYLQGMAQSMANLWRVRVDPQSLRWLSAPEAITTSQMVLWTFSLSRDGTRLLYSSCASDGYPLWSLPFDAATGRVLGEGQAVRAFGIQPAMPWLSPDGTRLVYQSDTQGHAHLHEEDLSTGAERVLSTDVAENRLAPSSADGTRIAYPSARSDSLMLLTRASGQEEAIGSNLIPWRLFSGWPLARRHTPREGPAGEADAGVDRVGRGCTSARARAPC